MDELIWSTKSFLSFRKTYQPAVTLPCRCLWKKEEMPFPHPFEKFFALRIFPPADVERNQCGFVPRSVYIGSQLLSSRLSLKPLAVAREPIQPDHYSPGRTSISSWKKLSACGARSSWPSPRGHGKPGAWRIRCYCR